MNRDQFCQTDKLILNYFVPYTSGKFIASCLMFSSGVYKMLSIAELKNRLGNTGWTNVEYSDVDFWWKDHNIDWFSSDDWFQNLSASAIDAIGQNQYVFYTCHELYSVRHLKNLFPNAQVLMIVPDYSLCKRNYLKKNTVDTHLEFNDSRVYKELQEFAEYNTDLVVKQTDIYNTELFIQTISNIACQLNLEIKIEELVNYRKLYLSHNLNK